MLEKEPSGALPKIIPAPQPESAAPGGPFPQAKPTENSVPNASQASYQYTLHYLIAAIKKLKK